VSADLEADLIASLRTRRRHNVILAIAVPLLVAAAITLGLARRDRRVVLVGGTEEVAGRITGHARFRLRAPYSGAFHLGPGVHAIEEAHGPARASISVTYAPWVATVAAPIEDGQCLIVADGGSFYGAEERPVHVHDFTTETREVAMPLLFADRVVVDPCELPRAIRLTETMAVVLSVPCADAPRDAEAAGRRILDRWNACTGR
jgi:hypothetical protein